MSYSDKVPFLCDNRSEIKIATNRVQHSRMKHIFIMDRVARKDIELFHVGIEEQLADILRSHLMKQDFMSKGMS